GFNDVFALACSNDGTLWGITNADQLIKIDAATGAGAVQANVTGGLGSYFDLAFRPEDDVAFVPDSASNSLFKLNTITGALSLVGPIGGINTVGLAFLGGVPEPASLSLLAIAGVALRRRGRLRL